MVLIKVHYSIVSLYINEQYIPEENTQVNPGINLPEILNTSINMLRTYVVARIQAKVKSYIL